MGERLTYSVPEAARLLGVSPRHLYDLVHDGEVRSIRLGRRVLIPCHVLDSLVGAS